jgi:hypothetical protein
LGEYLQVPQLTGNGREDGQKGEYMDETDPERDCGRIVMTTNEKVEFASRAQKEGAQDCGEENEGVRGETIERSSKRREREAAESTIEYCW